jgi:hypothetical protein
MSNKLISTKYPFLPLSIHVRVSTRKQIDLTTQALIDTGFSGDIVVPATGELKQSTPGCAPQLWDHYTVSGSARRQRARS